jgi:hypothetical protein
MYLLAAKNTLAGVRRVKPQDSGTICRSLNLENRIL